MPLLSHTTTRLVRTTSALLRSSPAQQQLTAALRKHTRMSSSMAQRLKGKTVVITGASSGIGKSVALEFARTQPEDLKLIITARRLDTLKEVAQEINGFAKGVKVHPVKLDVSKPEEIQNFVGQLPDEFKEIDILVNNA